MNKSVMMIMAGALVVAILVAMIVQAKLSPKKEKNTASASIEVLVSTKKLMTGERLKPENVRWQEWPEKAVFKGVYKRADQPDEKELAIYDVPLRRDIESGEPITSQALIPDVKGGGNFLAASISEGMRAVAVNVKANTAAGGFIAPGDHVDVLLAYSVKMDSDAKDAAGELVDRYASQTILNNVKVLAVDQSSKDEGREAKVAKTVTIEVTREGAEVIALADKMGELSLSLRRLGDKDTEISKVTPITTDATISEVSRKVNQMMERSKTGSETVRIYSGTAVQNVPVRAGAQ